MSVIQQGKSDLTLLRWAGSKRKLLPTLAPIIQSANANRYIEPFFGSGCLFFSLLPSYAILGDLNKDLINFYKQLRSKPRVLHKLISSYKTSSKDYYQNRTLFNCEQDPTIRAALFFYLNRLSFNGIYRTNMNGDYNVPMGSKYGKFPSIDDFCMVAKTLKGKEFIQGDFSKCLENVKCGDIVYLDPPYDYSGRIDRGEYGAGAFNKIDLTRLKIDLEMIDSKGAKFVLSYLDVPDIGVISKQWNSIGIDVKRQVASFSKNRKTVREMLIMNFTI